jgi:hypothetical protein
VLRALGGDACDARRATCTRARQFFNAELLVREVNDKGVEQEVAGLHTVRSETRSLWSQEYNDSCEKNAGADSLPGLHGAVMHAIRDLHLAQGPTLLRLNVVHRFGTMHQVVEDGEAGWVRKFRDVVPDRDHRLLHPRDRRLAAQRQSSPARPGAGAKICTCIGIDPCRASESKT